VGLAKGLQVVGEFLVGLAEGLQVGPEGEFQVGPAKGDFAEQNPSVLAAGISGDG
jgi:hypothetical protein